MSIYIAMKTFTVWTEGQCVTVLEGTLFMWDLYPAWVLNNNNIIDNQTLRYVGDRL